MGSVCLIHIDRGSDAEREARWQGKCLLGTGQHIIELPLVKPQLGPRDSAHAVDETKDSVAVRAVGDCPHIIQRAGRCFGMHYRDCAVFPNRKPFVQLGYRVYLSPCNVVTIDIAPAHRGDMRKSLRECPIYEAKDSSGRRAANGRLHHASSRRRADIDRAIGFENGTKPFLKPFEQPLEFSPAVGNHGPQHRGHDVLTNFGGAGEEESAKALCRAHSSIRSLSWSKFSMTKSAWAITGSRLVKPVNAAKPWTTDLISRSVIPSPTASIGPLSFIWPTMVRFPLCRVSSDASSNPAYPPSSSKNTETAWTFFSSTPSSRASGRIASRKPPLTITTAMPRERNLAMVFTAPGVIRST